MKKCRLALPANPGGALHLRLSSFLDFVASSIRARCGVVQARLAWIVLPALGLLLANASIAATAPPVNLTWNSNPENNITGYRVSYGTQAGVYPNTVNVGTTPAASITGLSEGGTYYFVVAAVNQAGLQGAASDEVSYQIPTTTLIPSTGWTLKYADSQESLDYRASYAFDNDPLTIWHTSWSNSPTLPPHEIQIDLGSNQSVSGFRYLPRTGSWLVGNVGQYEFYVSMDGVSWGTPVAAGIFPNTGDLKEARFPETTARFVRLRGMTDANGGTYMSAAEIYLIQGTSTPATNQAPVAAAKSITTSESTAATVTLSGTDADGNALTYSVATAPTKGTLSGTAPNLTYTPNAGYTGSDSFTYVANDGIVNSAAAVVSVTVTPVNHAPVATQQSVSTPEDTAVAIVLTGSDSDGNALTYSVASGPAHGSLSGTAPNLTYTPAANYNGGDSFTFRTNDGLLNSAAATVSITVTPVNDAPVAVAKSVTTPQDTSLPVTLTGTDVDGNALTFSIVSGPANGTLGGTAPNLTYSPTAGYVGNDSFTFRVNDGTVDSATAVVSIAVTAVNHPPVATQQSVTTAEDTAVAVVLSGSDSDGNPITYAIVGGPAHGSLSGTAPNLTYTPAANYNGGDSFTFRVNDGLLNSAVATVSITVTAVNDAPVATAKSVTTTQDSALPITLAGTDIDGNALTFSVASGPVNGTLAGTPPNLTYTPTAGYVGGDSFTFKANDGLLDSATAVVSITVAAVNHPPVAVEKPITTAEDTAVAFVLSGSDSDANPITYAIASGPAHGSLAGTAPNLTYTPAANYNGSDSFTFRVNDGMLNSAAATVSITVTPVNDAPVVTARSVTTTQGSSLPVTLTGTDVEGNALTFSIVTSPTNGTLAGTPPNLVYQPAAGFSGSDQFIFKANDGTADSANATISITVNRVLPETSLTALARTGWTLKSVDSQELFDAPGERAFDGDPGTFWHTKWRTSSLPALPHEIQINLGSIQNISGFKYLPRQDGLTIGNIGAYQFFVSLDGEKWGSAVATGTFGNSSTEKVVTFSTKSGKYVRLRALSEVNGNADTCVAELNILKGALINQPPLALSQSVTTEVDTPASVSLAGMDLEGTPLTYSIISGPAHGTLTGTIPNLTYVPAPDYIGEDQFTFRTNDGAVYSETAAVSLTVTPVAEVPGNFAPAFASESISDSATEDSAFSGLLSATDANAGDTLTYRKLSGPAWLTVAADGTLGGTPLNGNVGTNIFTVKVADQFRASATATLTITVSNVNDAPVFKFNPIVYPAGTEKVDYREQTLASIAFDPDLGDSFTYSKVSGPEWLSVSTKGVLKGTPPANSAGLNQFTIRATDSNGVSSESVLQIKINPNNLPLPWKLERVGSGNLAGPAKYSAGVFTVGGSGALEEKSDAGNFGWQSLSGDGQIIACVEKVDDTGPATRVGLMIRDSLAADSRQVFIGFSGKSSLRWMRRATTGGAAKESALKVPDAKETWLRLTRDGDVITAYRSKNGKKWTKVGSISQALPANCYIGLSVSSGDKDLLNTSKFSHVRVNP